MMKLIRACISTDIQPITEHSERYGRKLLQKIKDFLAKEPYQFITTREFAKYSGIEEKTVIKYIVD